MAKGDQIYVYRELFNLPEGYKHHGIDCGDGTVIHYRKPSEVVERTSLSTFTRGNKVYVCEYKQEFCFINDIVVHRAESRLGERKYNLLFNNCEHFATWCKTGISDSKQIREFIPMVAHSNLDKFATAIGVAFQDTNEKNAQRILNQAISDIKVVWDQIQPQYQEAIKEVKSWEEVAKKALLNNRDDLAKAALQRKGLYKAKAIKLQSELAELAKMTESLLKNSPNLTKSSSKTQLS